MAFGFGFNRTKVLAAAERYIQQGKLQNAISEYEKAVKADPKDLTILNTIGDLYARIGQTEKAVSFFKSVGETYANQGFTVKAIAMYKKLTKLKPSVESALKLAELYNHQGLQNDARAQYLLVAEQFLRAGQLEQTARIFQKILEIDPENTAMQVRLADVYVRLERKEEARKLLLRAAEALHARGAKNETEEVLVRVLELDPSNKQALLLRGASALKAGNADLAIQSLEKVSGLDTHPEGLRLLTRAYLLVGRTVEAGPLAKELFSLHQDASALSAYADALLKAGEYEEALRVYHHYADRLLTGDSAGAVENLYSCVHHVKENAGALNLLRQIYERIDDKLRLGEVAAIEAKLCEQSGDLAKARDLYLQLAALEPANLTYGENYNRLVAQLGGEHGDGKKPLAIEDLNTTAPEVGRDYSEDLAAEIRRTVTDADLFVSYNMIPKAILPLEDALAKAPDDAMLNRRLAALYARENRIAEAAQRCQTLHDIYLQAGFADYADKYGELAGKYRKHVGADEPAPPPAMASAAPETAAALVEPPPTVVVPLSIEASPPSETAQEIDISNEWEHASSTVEEVPVSAPESAGGAASAAERIEEIKFYLQHGLREEAQTAIERCAAEFPNLPELAFFREQLTAQSLPTVAPALHHEPPAHAAGNTLGELAADLESSLAEELVRPVPAPEPQTVPARMAAAASAGSSVVTMSTSASAAAPISRLASPSAASLQQADSDLAEIFSEFKEDLEESGRQSQDEEPETHYNLGVAFKEMGLLDEAIGELQKVCQAIERGQSFPHVMQAFTWLAQCFLEKGVPQAAVRWYEKALKLPGIDEEAQIALHYELAAAYESSNNKPAALSHFMEVYGSNIDYRDVAERIKALKS